MACVNLVLTVNRDTAEPPEDLSGALSLEGPDGIRLAPFSKEIAAGKYTFNIFTDGDYFLNYYYTDNNVFNTQRVKLATIKMPVVKKGTITPTVSTKSASIKLATKEGVAAGNRVQSGEE